MGRPRLYNTEEERKAAQREANRKWRKKHPEYMTEYRQTNKEKIAERKAKYYQANKEKKLEYMAKYNAEYYQANKEKKLEYHAEYNKTPMGRACNIVQGYKRADKKHNRGKCTLTAKWVVENIFPKPCHYCGETGWQIIGCDRIDNSKPHTPDNVVPCCAECNKKRHTRDYEEFKLMIEDGEIKN